MRGLHVLTLVLAAAGAAAAQPRKPVGRDGAPALERWSRMTPEERERHLERLPPERRARIEERLERFNRLPAPARRRLREQYDHFQRLAPRQQQELRGYFRDFNSLPADRQVDMRRELFRLRNLPPRQRRSRLDSSEFRTRFSATEQELLKNVLRLTSPEEQPLPDTP